MADTTERNTNQLLTKRIRSATPSMKLYSQHGEDAVILAAFPDVERGYFVEVGCIDGRRFSNTLSLEEKGWRGLCVEAHPDYIDAIRSNRPRSTVVHAAVADRDDAEAPFYANHRGALSTLDKNQEERFARDYKPWFGGFTEILVPMRRLSTILDEQGSPHVHVLSIDIEGSEPAALRGLDLSRHRPELIVVEADDEPSRAEIRAVLFPSGYHEGPEVAGNVFYFTDPTRIDTLRGKRFEGHVIATRHPLDSGDDQCVAYAFTT